MHRRSLDVLFVSTISSRSTTLRQLRISDISKVTSLDIGDHPKRREPVRALGSHVAIWHTFSVRGAAAIRFCFVRAFCRVNNVVGRRTLDPKRPRDR